MTHTYPSAVLPVVGSLPACGCAAPEWFDPSNTLAGCGNCGRAMDPRLCCPGPPTSSHWPAWLAARHVLEADRVRLELALLDAEHRQRVDQRRKDAGRTRADQQPSRWRAPCRSRARQIVSVRGHHKRADEAEVRAARAALDAVARQIADLRNECCMCSAAWDRLVDGWRAVAYGSAEYRGARAALERAEADHEAAPTVATLRTAADAAHAFRVAQARAIDRARLAEMTA